MVPRRWSCISNHNGRTRPALQNATTCAIVIADGDRWLVFLWGWLVCPDPFLAESVLVTSLPIIVTIRWAPFVNKVGERSLFERIAFFVAIWSSTDLAFAPVLAIFVLLVWLLDQRFKAHITWFFVRLQAGLCGWKHVHFLLIHWTRFPFWSVVISFDSWRMFRHCTVKLFNFDQIINERSFKKFIVLVFEFVESHVKIEKLGRLPI